MKIALIIVAATDKQNTCFWPSYNNAVSGLEHDLIIVHRDNRYLPQKNEKTIYENMIIAGTTIPHRAFGSYRYFFNKYKNDYDYFGFISDDVVIKSDNWLKRAIYPLVKYENLGWVGMQIFNSGACEYKYPAPSHNRAAIWFAKSDSLNKINWVFENDHDGEMLLAEQFLSAGFFGIQVGNKINIAYDALEKDHITQLLEIKYFGEKHLLEKFTPGEDIEFNELLNKYLKDEINEYIESPYGHIGKRDIITQIEPFDGLIFDKSVAIAKKNCDVITLKNDIYRIKCEASK